MYKIDEILNKIGIEGPESEYWQQLEKRFTEQYQVFLNMQEANKSNPIFDEDIKQQDNDLSKMIYDLHDFDESDVEPQDVDENENQDSVEKEIDEEQKQTAEGRINEKESDLKKEIDNEIEKLKSATDNRSLSVVTEQSRSKAEVENIEPEKKDMGKKEKEEPKNTVETTQELSKKEGEVETPEEIIEKAKNESPPPAKEPVEEVVVDETVETTHELSEQAEVKTPPHDEYPELTAYLKDHSNISAKTLKQCGVAREIWNENSFEFSLNGYTFRKTSPGDLLFNQWTVFENTNTGL